VPDKTCCPRCGRVGFVRRERIIKGDSVKVAYYCGACDHAWDVVEPPPAKSST
jgi:hypothetical protein